MGDELHEELARASNRIVSLILFSDVDWVDIAIEENIMRERVSQEAPDRIETFERIYPARFRRIWEQWRGH